jgi:hypothetical protein
MNLGESTIRRALDQKPNVSGAALLICLAHTGFVPADYKDIIYKSRKTKLRLRAKLACLDALEKQQKQRLAECDRDRLILSQVSNVWFVLAGLALLVLALVVTIFAQ